MNFIVGRNAWFLCCLHYKCSLSDTFTERLSSDKLFQQSVCVSAETVRRVDSVLEVILLRSGLLYLLGSAVTRQDYDYMLETVVHVS